MENYQNGFGWQGIDPEAFSRALGGTNVRQGCTPSKGTNALEVDIAAGTIQIDGSDTDVSAQTVTLSGGSGDPRKDVVYLDGTGTAQVVGGTPQPAEPSGEIRRQTYYPQPVDLSGVAGVPIAEVWVPAGASDFVADDISDRRPLIGMGTVPSGAIVMWSGAIGDIPDGWTLCDGTDGTPDLRDRFIVGAGGSYASDATGGEESVTLTEAEMPSHSHDANVDKSSGSGSNTLGGGFTADGTVSNAVDPTGGDGAHENRPPFYALAHIQKL